VGDSNIIGGNKVARARVGPLQLATIIFAALSIVKNTDLQAYATNQRFGPEIV
jgi:hypothetical protein